MQPDDLSKLRLQAETKLAAGKHPAERAIDPLRLVHELQVHEIELELQNEELVAANHDLDALRAKYQALYEAAPIGYLTLSASGAIVECNPRAADMLGHAREALVKMQLRECFESGSLPAFDKFFESASVSTETLSADNLLLHRPSSVPIYVRAQGRSLRLPVGELVVVVVLVDVSALKYAIEDVVSAIQMLPGVALK
jgi:PAS domain S-box-containing protein